MDSQNSSRSCKNVFIAVVLITGFSAIFYMYYEPSVNWLNCPVAPKHDDCGNISINRPNQIQIVNDNCSVNFTSVQHQLTQTEAASSQGDDLDTIILVWMWPFGHQFDLGLCSSMYDIHGCHLTVDKSQFNKAHGVLIHHRDIHGDLSNMPKLPRPPFQKWVWMNMESPTHTARHSNLNNLFNLTSSYRLDSDILVPYGRILENTGGKKDYEIPRKNKLVCWIVSNWNPNFRRSKFYGEFEKHISVQTYGNHFNKRIGDQDYTDVMSSCKFYLSFENSIHKDYITEKLYRPLSLGTVPVVIGPPRANYEEFIPASAFIHVDDFKTPKELADHLKLLDQNDNLYRQHFTWREHFFAKGGSFGLEHACYSCDHIRRNKNYRVVNDLNSWFWG
ncbi:4-galactosyl-N-acetylglucosaminide 3-alpha-L-fucosyltransferase 9-like [Pimephales promelas]|uniref:4-galactosyl-N-acetylglucosaminide 3-alpha-L-fucosyltransferase 9-like n=1 Tax=Pimephales promelas TaxID=90988 RepID=UPI001955498A|nr:4-galactosyl-N-acetylglucosaminide 3-alpha-L-fucosyltransferase 9-like [Pimephales promelas]